MQLEPTIVSSINNMANRMRRSILEVALEAGALSSHLGGGLSFVDISAALFGHVMKYDTDNPEWKERDRFILSKGHGVLGYYSALYDIGVITKEELLSFEKSGSFLLGHPVKNRAKGIEFSNGSLGMGLSLGIGVALTNRIKKRKCISYVILGDGECNEGSVWEAAMSAAHYQLNNVVAIVDRNTLQQTGSNKQIMDLGNAADKFRSFNWFVREIDGHDIEAILQALLEERPQEKPLAIIAHTRKGKGFSFCEDNNAWHHAVLSRSQYEKAMEELPTECRGESW